MNDTLLSDRHGGGVKPADVERRRPLSRVSGGGGRGWRPGETKALFEHRNLGKLNPLILQVSATTYSNADNAARSETRQWRYCGNEI